MTLVIYYRKSNANLTPSFVNIGVLDYLYRYSVKMLRGDTDCITLNLFCGGTLLCFRRILRPEPLAPSSFKRINFGVPFCQKFLCQTDTGVFVRSGTIQYQGLIFGVSIFPLFEILRSGPLSPFYFKFR